MKVVFGVGALDRVPTEVAALDLHRVLVIAGGAATPAGDRLAEALGPRLAGRFGRVAQHVPEQLAAEAVAAARELAADGLCSVGGGSATGLAKAVAVALGLPIVAVPTTYAGSEATAVYGVTGERKRTATDPRARVTTVVYDPALTVGLPARVTAASAFNALAHATATLTGPGHDPISQRDATEAVTTIARALPVAVRQPSDLDARGALLRAGWLAASSLAVAGLHHRLCHVLGGRYGLVHAEVHAALLPHTLARDQTLSLGLLAQVLGGDPATVLRELGGALGVPGALAELGMPADKLADAAEEAAVAVAPDHPRHGDAAWFRALLEHAY
jgi:maleylacetate reductase